MRLLVLAVFTAVLAVSCGAALQCDARSVTVSGDLSKDLLGTWDGWGIDSRVVATFHADGGALLVESPNQYAPHGNSSVVSWSVDGGVLTFLQGAQLATVSSTDLTVSELDGGFPRVHPAIRCTGDGT